MSRLLDIENLHVTFRGQGGPVCALRGVTFEVQEGEIVGLVGESGCGKSVTALSVMGLLSSRQCRMEGQILFDHHNLVNLPESQYRHVRGRQIGMVFQDPPSALNPTMTIGRQVGEAMSQSKRSAVLDLLDSVGIADPANCYHRFPHQLSGGMCQRVLIAMAIAPKPRLLIADEPTTALDPTLQEQILQLLRERQQATGMALVLITHDIGLVARHCNRVIVMYAGQVVEKGPTSSVLERPQHPYTRGLLASVPSLDGYSLLVPIPGTPPDLRLSISGCAFHARCSRAMQICSQHCPTLDRVAEGHRAACWLHDPRASKESS